MSEEFNNFEKNFRAVYLNDVCKVYNEKSGVEIDRAISFDSEKEEFSSIDLFVASIASEIILSMIAIAKKKNEILQDVEAKVSLYIENPMYLLNVVGYEEKSKIKKISLDIYFYSFMEGEELDKFLEEVLNRTLIYNSIRDLVEVKFKIIL